MKTLIERDHHIGDFLGDLLNCGLL